MALVRSFPVGFFVWLALFSGMAQAQNFGTAFTYQGRLVDNGAPASGSYDLQCRLYTAASGGALIGSAVTIENVTVQQGLFTVNLDFGPGRFNGFPRWLQIDVRPGAATGAFTPLSPRQPVRPAPYSFFAHQADLLDGLDSTAFLRTTPPYDLAAPLPGPLLRLANQGNALSPGLLAETSSTAANAAAVIGRLRTPAPGNSAAALYGEVTNPAAEGGIGVFGNAPGGGWGVSGLSGTGTGVSGHSGSSYGVAGYVTSPGAGGNSAAVYGFTNSTSGRAVVGESTQPTGPVTGVEARIASDEGTAMRAWSSSTAGGTALTALHDGSAGNAIYANSSSTTGTVNGLFTAVQSPNASAISANNDAETGRAYAVYAKSESRDAVTVLALANATTGSTTALSGRVSSPTGVGVFGHHNALSGAGVGVYGLSTTPNANTRGVFGSIANVGSGALSAGVEGANSSVDGDGFGVYGRHSGSGPGVYGTSTSGFGVRGFSSTTGGVYGETGGTGAAVYARHNGSAAGYAGLFETGSASASAVQATNLSSAASAPIIKVLGNSTAGGARAVSAELASTAPGGNSAALHGINRGTNNNGHGVHGVHNGGGNGVLGATSSGRGVYGTAEGGIGVSGVSETGVGVRAQSTSGAILEAYDLNPATLLVDLRFRVANNGNVTADGTFSSPAADFAELLPAAPGLQPGDVLIIGGDGKLMRSQAPAQSTLAGVYSTQPGFLGGDHGPGAAAGKVPLAMVGVVPTRVTAENGPIEPGDLLITADTPGHAMKAPAEPKVGTVLGKALAPWAAGRGVISVLVNVK